MTAVRSPSADSPRTPPARNFVDRVFEIRKRPGGAFPHLIGVGRARNVDVVLPFQRISKYHAYVTGKAGRFFIADAGSANGTEVAWEFEGWRQTYFTIAQLADPLVSGPSVGADGVWNHLRYALGLTPFEPSA